MPLGYNNDDGAQALDQQQEIDFRRGWQVVDAASGSNLVTDGTGSYDVDVAAGDINTPTGTVACSAATIDLESLVDPDLPRIVLVYRDASGTAQTLAGTPAAKQPEGETAPGPIYQPAPDAFSTTDGVVLATVLLEAAASSVGSAQIRDRRMPASLNVDSAEVGSLNAEDLKRTSDSPILIGSIGRREDFDGADADARLDAALSAASSGDTIYLEPAEYVNDRTISTGLEINASTGGYNSGSQLNATWTINSSCVIDGLQRGGADFAIVVNSGGSRLNGINIFGPDTITIEADSVRVIGCQDGNVTFESGTSGGIVDSCTGVSVVDNGSNTVGDIA